MKRIRFWSRKLFRRVVQEFGSRFYFNPDADLRKSILVAGTARSGTTWLGDLIASQVPCRILFEPFNPNLVPEYRSFSYFQYLRPDTENPELYAFAQNVFTGKIRNRWIDRQNERIISKFRLVKEIRANLALKWLHDNFPEIPIIFLMRHPCAVVSSRMELGWATDSDIQPFLSQPDLMADYLCEHREFIRNAKTDEEKHAIIWSINNLVPLKQFQPGELKIIYYEHLCTQPEIEIPGIFESIGQKWINPVIDKTDRPSQTTRAGSAVVIGMDRVRSWKNKLSSIQINNILKVVDVFGLSHVYGESFSPLNKNDD